ncbi:hypothetical protein D9756_002419 [Leucocoprinus leucothites]|uniref:Fatty acid desaturase domain-containing protein n=1 Tax=Leucocoprinus leucothites TaxID=201217 RepID=A0A8H5GCM0_9AGAR|nr:hypothetical protein D9756_002419 [Leucoagaricus leucothites]
MVWFQIFQDGPEFETRRRKRTFTPPNLSLKDLHNAIPRHLFERSTLKSSFYVVTHILLTALLHVSAKRIPTTLEQLAATSNHPVIVQCLLKPAIWMFFWGWQGMFFAGIWCLGHEAGHDALSPKRWVNSLFGLSLHTFVLTPYYSWRATHRSHHKSTNNLERDETYIPPTRKSLKLPDGRVAVRMDYADILEETPAFTLFKLFIRQFL